ncbi:transglutaminase-like domain-containing protein [Microvirga pudoricolor]|uniref:transglutaminase-like domain-containing protein n=1 Tax=Microvirga pudoricolor TaxID=2778729 RepID=UPI00194FD129|nr:transglutaminase family protein [Microvirga pudoricolor]MBM6592606.1 transglutaminase family protein [Microvirga pudoricolor]
MNDIERRLYLSPAEYVDSDHPRLQSHAVALTAGIADPVERARVLYKAVRDGIRYDPYVDYTVKDTFRASSVLAAGHGYCVGKAALYAALCRASGIPARVGLSDVRNHLATPQLLEAVGTDVFGFHGYVDIHLDDRWIKVTPTFNDTLCAKLGVAVLEFDGASDALFQPFNGAGREFMEYVAHHGTYFDVPAKFLIREMAQLYPKLCKPGGYRDRPMEDEAAALAR